LHQFTALFTYVVYNHQIVNVTQVNTPNCLTCAVIMLRTKIWNDKCQTLDTTCSGKSRCCYQSLCAVCASNLAELNPLYIVSALVPPCVADVDYAVCSQFNKRTLLLPEVANCKPWRVQNAERSSMTKVWGQWGSGAEPLFKS